MMWGSRGSGKVENPAVRRSGEYMWSLVGRRRWLGDGEGFGCDGVRWWWWKEEIQKIKKDHEPGRLQGWWVIRSPSPRDFSKVLS
ncbi:hypothetical protein KFK09_001948 [Dendrobium nobile]|uniref:Uncharacterized protein n=1 Tax=Dendrobium nobile TaxID=94219 RepID=A0A8T3CB01_DENNO|nr:hypothetical protein KFK09_001948 [Dendrobium nobile]